MLCWGLLLFAEIRASTRAETVAWLAVLIGTVFLALVGSSWLQRIASDLPASAELIADFLALEPYEVRERVIARHATWRHHAPTELLTISLVNIWCRMAASQIAAEAAPLLPAYTAALAQDRGFLSSNQG